MSPLSTATLCCSMVPLWKHASDIYNALVSCGQEKDFYYPRTPMSRTAMIRLSTVACLALSFSYVSAIKTVVFVEPGFDPATRPAVDVPWPDHNTSDTVTIEARDFKGCSARTTYGDYCGWDNAWDNLWGIRDNICNYHFNTNGGAFRYTYYAWAGTGAGEIKAGKTSEHCWNAFSTILWKCFDTENGETSTYSTALSGTWSNSNECQVSDSISTSWSLASRLHYSVGLPKGNYRSGDLS
ncbi:hypothetical protein BR93DRAFT_774465 [Coniochaeta sp. PMI_546]|nr:hypothetical protein BR93DRAFT_774465 [Coniochaeta sp. PMI_546]